MKSAAVMIALGAMLLTIQGVVGMLVSLHPFTPNLLLPIVLYLGVTPDIAVAASAALDAGYEAALEAVLKLDLPDAEKTEARWTLEALRAPAVSFAAADYLGTFGDAVITESDKGLVLTRGRRPPVTLKPVSADLFAFADALYWRVQFDRDTHGKVEAANILSASGNATRLRRAE